MNAAVLAVIGITCLFVGYRFYSKFIAEKIYQLDPSYETPAHSMRDDIDYIPTKRIVLWGHHFTAVAGAAPIIGPGIAVIWGWLPAFIWVIVGTMFFAGVQLSILGVVGEYLGRVFLDRSGHPQYVIRYRVEHGEPCD